MVKRLANMAHKRTLHKTSQVAISDHTISTKRSEEKKSKDDVFACPNYDIRSHSQMQIPIHSQKEEKRNRLPVDRLRVFFCVLHQRPTLYYSRFQTSHLKSVVPGRLGRFVDNLSVLEVGPFESLKIDGDGKHG